MNDRTAMNDWNAGQYLKFEDERTRAPRDLLAQVPLERARRVFDLGCGPGNSTELLLSRFPQAEVVGLDSSPNMLAKARARLPHCRFVETDIASWTPDADVDLLFANASMQWVPEHGAVLRRLLGALRRGGVLAVQMPDNTREAAHVLQRQLIEDWQWPDAAAPAPLPRDELPAPETYYDLLGPSCSIINIWHVVYNHALPSAAAIVEWFKGSSLQPVLGRLDAAGRDRFLAAYAEGIARAYPPRYDGKVLLRFPRLFIVAVR